MDSDTFIENALRTESRPQALGMNLAATTQLLDVLVSAGDVADTFKRGVYYGKGLDKDKLNHQLEQLKAQIDLLHAALPQLDKPEDNGQRAHDLIAPNLRLLHCALGLFTESSELLLGIRRNIGGEALDIINFGEELGDCHWYAAIGHHESGVSMQAAWEAVINKLKARYGHRFTPDAAHCRDLEAERDVLEKALS